MKCNEIQAGLLLSMWQASALPNAHFTEPRSYRPLNDGSGSRLGTSDWFDHNFEFYAGRMVRARRPHDSRSGDRRYRVGCEFPTRRS